MVGLSACGSLVFSVRLSLSLSDFKTMRLPEPFQRPRNSIVNTYVHYSHCSATARLQHARLCVHTVGLLAMHPSAHARVSSQGNTPSLEIHLAIHSNGARAAGHTATHGPTDRAYAVRFGALVHAQTTRVVGRLLLRVTCVLVRSVAIAQANVAAKMCTATATTAAVAAADRCVRMSIDHKTTATEPRSTEQQRISIRQQPQSPSNANTTQISCTQKCVRAVCAPPVAAQFNARSPENATPLMPMRMQRAREHARARTIIFIYFCATSRLYRTRTRHTHSNANTQTLSSSAPTHTNTHTRFFN